MTIDCSFSWPEILRIAGPCIRPGGPLTRLGFSLLLWEEHERLLKEFVARMILAGERLPDPWGCRQGQEKRKANRPQISYFLLVARKSGAAFQSVENKGDGTSWTT